MRLIVDTTEKSNETTKQMLKALGNAIKGSNEGKRGEVDVIIVD